MDLKVREKRSKSLSTWFSSGAKRGVLKVEFDQFEKERLNICIKNEFKNIKIPTVNTVYDFYYDASKKEPTFIPWSDKVP